jgi:hypothetical protein
MGNGRKTVKGEWYGISFGAENILKLTVMVVLNICVHRKNVHLTSVNYFAYLNKTITERQ